jgi:hypothetical protein
LQGLSQTSPDENTCWTSTNNEQPRNAETRLTTRRL